MVIPYHSIRTALETARDRAGKALKRDLSDVTPHTLRHTFASRLVMSGVDLRTVQEYGGWSDLEMVQRYAHLSPAHRASAIDRIPTPIPTAPAGVPSERSGERDASAVDSRLASRFDAGVAQRQSN